MYTRTAMIVCTLVVLASLSSLAMAASPMQDDLAAGLTVYLPHVMTAGTETPDDPGNDTFFTGDGTFYNATGEGNCSFDVAPDRMVAAMNRTDYAESAICGAYVEITGPKGTITVRITDQCPECQPGDIDLSREAFALIANPVDGRVPIRWRVVSPELNGPIVYHFKEGSNQWWTAVQIRNHRNPIARVEYLASDGTFRNVPRLSYNYFVESSGMGPGPYTFRVTDIYGNSISDSGVVFREAGDVTGSQQFPSKR